MEENIYYSMLFDFYGSLLTEKQRCYFKDYFFDNLLIDEIGENECISKNAVSKQILEAKKKLDFYEDKLKLYKRRELLKEEFKNEEDILKRIAKYDNIVL